MNGGLRFWLQFGTTGLLLFGGSCAGQVISIRLAPGSSIATMIGFAVWPLAMVSALSIAFFTGIFGGLLGYLGKLIFRLGSSDDAAWIGILMALLGVPIIIGVAGGAIAAAGSESITLLEGIGWFGGLNTILAVLSCVLLRKGLLRVIEPGEGDDLATVPEEEPNKTSTRDRRPPV